ncbi:selenocysteine-specific translation elongation factor [bacterium]|nr:selenocysteine-specific translation elongation factor [candidate division CSSED10-310 bacterium]
MKNIILGTAGHIDHGKTLLIKSLTGINTDRLPEEISRGITIELGFAHLDLDDSIRIGIVDVPGHEKFIHHMVAGVGGIDMVMLVIAADEGIMPQTREHIDICGLLGIRNGIVVLSKTDLVDSEWTALVTEDVENYLAHTFLAGCPILGVSSTAGTGIESLKKALYRMASGLTERSDGGIFRLPVDRVFTMKGFGTVITGTVVSGRIDSGSAASLIPSGPDTKIRGLQVHGIQVQSIRSGQRAAANLQGVDKNRVVRGMVLCKPGEVPQTDLIDAECELLSSAAKSLKNRTRIRIYSGTAESIGLILLLDREMLKPGDRCMAQFRLETNIAVLPGDRFLLRTYSPLLTIGGGTVIDPETTRHRRYDSSVLQSLQHLRSPDLPNRLETWLDLAGTDGLTDHQIRRKFPADYDQALQALNRLLHSDTAITLPASPIRYISAGHWSRFKSDLVQAIDTFHRHQPLAAAMPKEELRTTLKPNPEPVLLNAGLAELQNQGLIADVGSAVKRPDFNPMLSPEQTRLMEYLIDWFQKAGFAGGEFKEIEVPEGSTSRSLLNVFSFLIEQKKLVRLPGGLTFACNVMSSMQETIRKLIMTEGFMTVGRFRDELDISRKQAVPLLEHFDRIGLTRRVQEKRILR